MVLFADKAEKQQNFLTKIDNAVQERNVEQAWTWLRQLPLEAFGELLLDVPQTLPALRGLLPSMASDEVQRNWTGNCGKPLLAQSCDFVRLLERACRQYRQHSIQGRVLDYGCGWGRIMRLMLHYVNPEQLCGVDPWDVSIDLCHQHNCPGELAVSDYVPKSLPVEGRFDLIYAFSVVTHLSEKTTDAVMTCLRQYINPEGLLAITIRPPTYWDAHQDWREGYTREALLERHEKTGFAFMPHYREPIEGDITYGDTTMTLDYIRRRWPQWQVVGTDNSASDPLQIVVFLQPS